MVAGSNLSEPPMYESIVAIDARLVGVRGTGDTTYWTGLLQGLNQIPSEFSFLLFSNAPQPANVPLGPSMRWVELKANQSRWWSLIQFPLKARRMGAKVLHTQYNVSPLAGNGSITTVHDVSFLLNPEWFKPTDRVLLSRFVPASVRRASKVITVSEASKRDILSHMPYAQSKTIAIPNACNPLIKPIPIEEARQIVEDELGVGGPYLLSVGT